MTPNEQFVNTLEKLLERSKKGEVNWQRSGQQAFKVTFQDQPRTDIFVAFGSPPAAPDWHQAALVVNGEAAIVLRAEDEIDTELLKLLRKLWTQAERSVVKWDLSLDAVNKALESEEKVGVAPIPDGSVPF